MNEEDAKAIDEFGLAICELGDSKDLRPHICVLGMSQAMGAILADAIENGNLLEENLDNMLAGFADIVKDNINRIKESQKWQTN